MYAAPNSAYVKNQNVFRRVSKPTEVIHVWVKSGVFWISTSRERFSGFFLSPVFGRIFVIFRASLRTKAQSFVVEPDFRFY